MAFIEDPGRVAETTTGTGTGAITVLGAVAGYQRFSAKLSVGDTFPGAIVASDNTWQEGIFTYSAANQITFTTILDGSSGTSQITLPAGTHTVFAGFLGMGKTISNAPAKATPVGADLLGLWDSVASAFKSLSITNLLALFRGANTFTAAQEWATGANIASASTVNLDTATGNRVHITGTTTITAVTLTRGPRTVFFDGALTLTHHATNNNLPGGANITTAAGDRAIYESDGTTVRCVAYTKASGLPVVSAASGLVLLATLTPTAAATLAALNVFSATYDTYLVVGEQITPAGADTLSMQFATSGSADSGGVYAYWHVENANPQTLDSQTKINLTASSVGSANGGNCSFWFHVLNANSATRAKTVLGKSLFLNGSVSTGVGHGLHGTYTTAAAASGLSFSWVGGNNFSAQGNIFIYGVSKT